MGLSLFEFVIKILLDPKFLIKVKAERVTLTQSRSMTFLQEIRRSGSYSKSCHVHFIKTQKQATEKMQSKQS